MSTFLDSDSLTDHLVDRGLIAPHSDVVITPLSGGVSSEIVAVSTRDVRLVVKKALPRLRVEAAWFSDTSRIVTEANALRLAGAIAPGKVPKVIDLDEETGTLVLEHADPTWTNWRDDLLAGRFDEALPTALGSSLALWHTTTSAPPPAAFASTEVFVQLRIEPFYRVTAAKHSRVAAQINDTADALLADPVCLVHGDFSPKNILHGSRRHWVVDWETAHVGSPVFDVAHLITHLVLKAIHSPENSTKLESAFNRFLGEYVRRVGTERVDGGGVIANLGCLLLARVDGKSPAPYLGSADRTRVRNIGLQLLRTPPATVAEVWGLL